MILLASLVGCSWLSPKRVVPAETSRFIQTGKIIAPQLLKKGGKIAIVPFTPGAGVEAGELSDKISLHIIKGISSILNERSDLFEIVTAENANEAELIIEGRLTQLQHPSLVKKLFMTGRKKSLGVSGRVIVRKTDEKIAIFTDQRDTRKKDQDLNQLAETVGQDIGRFILSEVK